MQVFKSILLLCLIAYSTAPINVATADIVTGPIVNPANGNRYYLLEPATWLESEAEAVTLGGHLTTVNDSEENDWIFDTFSPLIPNSSNLWIGLNDLASEGDFVWSSGQDSAFRNWAPGQPDNFMGTDPNGEHFVAIEVPDGISTRPARSWNDARATSLAHGVVEITAVPEPCFVGVGSLICCAALTIRRRTKR